MANEERYYDGRIGDLYIRPLVCKVVATFTGGTFVPSTTRRQSHPGVTVTDNGTGDFTFNGLPVGTDYHFIGFFFSQPTAANAVATASIQAFDAAAGTIRVNTKTAGAAAADPETAAVIYLTFEVETGAGSN